MGTTDAGSLPVESTAGRAPCRRLTAAGRQLKEHHAAVRAAIAELSPQLGRAPKPSEIAAQLRISPDEVLQALQAAESYQAFSLNQIRDAESDAGPSRLDRLGAPDPGMELFTDSHAVAPALAELPDRERSILIMRFYQDMTQTEITERVGVSQMHISRTSRPPSRTSAPSSPRRPRSRH